MLSYLFGGASKTKRTTRTKAKTKVKAKTKRTIKTKRGGAKKEDKVSVKCPKGQILRSAYFRKGYVKKDGKQVKGKTIGASCIKDQGKPGKGPKILPPIKHEGALRKFGYRLANNMKERELALKKAVKANGATEIIRRLNYIRILSKSRPSAYKKYTKDIHYVQKLRDMNKVKKGGGKKIIKKGNRTKKIKSVLKKTKRSKKGGFHVKFTKNTYKNFTA